MAETAERIVTENEIYGGEIPDESAPGAWVVRRMDDDERHVFLCAIFSNRSAAEAYIRDKEQPSEYTLSVWTINDTYPFAEGE